MKRQFGPALYFASDKVIFDALNHSKVTTDTIRELLSDRGIYVSAKTSKYELAQYFSRLLADYFDHQDIAIKLGKPQSKGRITYAEISLPVEKQEIIESIQAAQPILENEGNLVTLEVSTNKISVRIHYDHIDYTEVEFRQVQPRDGIIEFIKNDSGNFVVRSTQDNEIDNAVDKIFTQLNGARQTPVKQERISLESITDPALRCKFFELIVNGVEAHSFVTVTEAYCYKPRSTSTISDQEDDDELDKNVEDLPNVERVTLKGTGVTRSFVISELYAKGYYLVKVIWRVKPKSSLDADVFELEAQFTEPASCTNFSYQVKTAILFENGELTTKKRLPKLAEQDGLFRRIESAAKFAYSQIS